MTPTFDSVSTDPLETLGIAGKEAVSTRGISLRDIYTPRGNSGGWKRIGNEVSP